MNDNLSQQAAEKLAQRHVDLAQRVVSWFGFDRRREITWGPEYNQVARDIYVEACALVCVTPSPLRRDVEPRQRRDEHDQHQR